ncbi:hypothetical protein QJQ45_012358 [Haematococcus lacustris]|nr:hypothetical protein QJQ45_012358 [Haematococcus lacustris]
MGRMCGARCGGMVPPNPPPPPPAQKPLAQDPSPPPPAQEPPHPPAQDQPPIAAPGSVTQPQARPWGRWLDWDINPCLNFQRIGESMQRPLELCSWTDREALPAIGKEYQQGYKRTARALVAAVRRSPALPPLRVLQSPVIGLAGASALQPQRKKRKT